MVTNNLLPAKEPAWIAYEIVWKQETNTYLTAISEAVRVHDEASDAALSAYQQAVTVVGKEAASRAYQRDWNAIENTYWRTMDTALDRYMHVLGV